MARNVPAKIAGSSAVDEPDHFLLIELGGDVERARPVVLHRVGIRSALEKSPDGFRGPGVRGVRERVVAAQIGLIQPLGLDVPDRHGEPIGTVEVADQMPANPDTIIPPPTSR